MSGSGGGRSDYDTSRPISPPKPGGGGGGSAGGSGGGGGDDPCAISQDAPINSPNPKVVPGLAIGDVLSVQLSGSPPRVVIELRTSTGQAAGSLTHVGHLALIRCMQAGHSYEAEVIQRTGGAVIVRIERI